VHDSTVCAGALVRWCTARERPSRRHSCRLHLATSALLYTPERPLLTTPRLLPPRPPCAAVHRPPPLAPARLHPPACTRPLFRVTRHPPGEPGFESGSSGVSQWRAAVASLRPPAGHGSPAGRQFLSPPQAAEKETFEFAMRAPLLAESWPAALHEFARRHGVPRVVVLFAARLVRPARSVEALRGWVRALLQLRLALLLKKKQQPAAVALSGALMGEAGRGRDWRAEAGAAVGTTEAMDWPAVVCFIAGRLRAMDGLLQKEAPPPGGGSGAEAAAGLAAGEADSAGSAVASAADTAAACAFTCLEVLTGPSQGAAAASDDGLSLAAAAAAGGSATADRGRVAAGLGFVLPGAARAAEAAAAEAARVGRRRVQAFARVHDLAAAARAECTRTGRARLGIEAALAGAAAGGGGGALCQLAVGLGPAASRLRLRTPAGAMLRRALDEPLGPPTGPSPMGLPMMGLPCAGGSGGGGGGGSRVDFVAAAVEAGIATDSPLGRAARKVRW
jgi:hypothetical protein